METATPELPALEQTPERAAYLNRAVTALATVLIDSMLADVESARLTDGGSLTDRAMAMALRPWIPKLRAVFLAKLSETDPAGLERTMGAVATTIETILAAAPGDALERWTYEWRPGQPRPQLVPWDRRG